ncbi:mitochondrial 54S ribosomal protein uL13m MRPL23 [Sporobolomyces salmoneus]|uniref:mitochondrial 54S ribosomal protein uL13m MRPL23 n=1 Tax=Sporobolomyces salmoneus TaxID=183962 RepID=UPI003177BBE0
MPRLAINSTVGNTALAFTRTWRGVDATDQVLGRMATRIAIVLMGKHKPIYDQSNDCGDYVVVKNATKVKVTGKKEDQLIYRHHTMFPGGLKEIPYKTMMERKPEEIIRRAVSGMLPKNRLRQKRLDRLLIFPDNEISSAYEANLLKDYEGEFGKTWKQQQQGKGAEESRTPAA